MVILIMNASVTSLQRLWLIVFLLYVSLIQSTDCAQGCLTSVTGQAAFCFYSC